MFLYFCTALLCTFVLLHAVFAVYFVLLLTNFRRVRSHTHAYHFCVELRCCKQRVFLYYYSQTFFVSGLAHMHVFFVSSCDVANNECFCITTHELSSCQVSHACMSFLCRVAMLQTTSVFVSITNFRCVTSHTRKLVMPYLQQVCMVQVFLCVFTQVSWLCQVSNTKQETLLLFVYK